MPDLVFILPDGSEHGLEAPVGVSLMQVATGAGLAGIVAECGGSAMCATCHVWVDPAWAGRLPPPLPNELEMLECTAAERRPESRLSCQIRIDASLDGLRVRIPDRQT
jgi:2Fe-2S ferredoxin